ncbi:3-hydroxyacyl-CoA dehydrogenase NAD-binding domain-containing protein [Pseudoclavibacter sp. RFBB5]|uniref:3-hydroxyacyl-CoA dehydrogenase NAD-binding domain-containing protein n=1 Tax=Pseudoclavibacter sp. RFBB5 TaxID=2080574 RepID=UPI000CE9013A|nr:3-hydroxyacyl-CoA dehydrogenase NAD-binding domain-containing protein [Pseudoclavibacter sp. RFBB5]PPG31219.1 3-hydroxybutyryl-CoA dehydrogenase [Pseudoclavibacter sp. RFBB5]
MSIPSIATVVGSGIMGPGIAAVLARAGASVRVYDISTEALERAAAGLNLANTVLDQLGSDSVEGGSVEFLSDLGAALADSQFIVEAVPEKLELKKRVLAEIEATVAPTAIIATNTSGIPITTMAEGMLEPGRFIGMHWSNPPHLIPMIEVIKGEQTRDEIQDELVAIVYAFGYEAVIERETPGFVENRILYAIMRECLALVDEGIVTQEALDVCVKWGIGYKLSVVGPMRLLDMAGLDTYENVSGYLNSELDNSQSTSELISRLTAEGRLGMKSGGGLFEYGEGEVAAKRAAIVQGLVAARKALSSVESV